MICWEYNGDRAHQETYPHLISRYNIKCSVVVGDLQSPTEEDKDL